MHNDWVFVSDAETTNNSKKFWMITGDGNQPRVRHTNKKTCY